MLKAARQNRHHSWSIFLVPTFNIIVDSHFCSGFALHKSAVVRSDSQYKCVLFAVLNLLNPATEKQLVTNHFRRFVSGKKSSLVESQFLF